MNGKTQVPDISGCGCGSFGKAAEPPKSMAKSAAPCCEWEGNGTGSPAAEGDTPETKDGHPKEAP